MNVPLAFFDKRVDGLPQIERHLYLYLLVNPKSHYSGLYQLTVREMVEMTGIKPDTIRKRLATLKPLVFYDEGSSIVYMPDKLRDGHSQRLNQRQILGMVRYLKSINISFLTRQFLEDYPAVKEQVPEHFLGQLPTLYPILGASAPTEAQFAPDDSNVSPTSPADWGNIPHPADLEEPLEDPGTPSPLYIYNNIESHLNKHREDSVSNRLPSGSGIFFGEGGCGGENLSFVPENGKLKPDDLLALWNTIRPLDGNGRTMMTPERQRSMRLRLKFRPEKEYWVTIFNKIKNNSFLRGEVDPDRPWQATLDWCLKNDTNHTKIFEGKYDRNEISPHQPPVKKRKIVCPDCKGSGWRLEHVEGKNSMRRVRCECKAGTQHPAP